MAITLRLPAELYVALRAAAEEDHRSVQQEVAHAGDVVYGSEAVRALVRDHRST